MIVPLEGITWELIRKAVRKPGYRLSARIPGIGKDGGPNCGRCSYSALGKSSQIVEADTPAGLGCLRSAWSRHGFCLG
jgi:hypothetical protein